MTIAVELLFVLMLSHFFTALLDHTSHGLASFLLIYYYIGLGP